MTTQEVRKKVSESPHKEWFQNLSVDLSNISIGYKTEIKGITAIYDFLLKQIKGYEEYTSLPSQLEAEKKWFTSLKKRVLNVINSDNGDRYEWGQIAQTFVNHKLFPSDTVETIFLLKVGQEFPNYFPGAWEFINGEARNIQDRNYLIGHLMAYEHMLKDKSEIVKRSNNEKKVISSITDELHEQLVKNDHQLTEHLNDADKKCDEFAQKINMLHETKNSSFDKWFEASKNEFQNFYSNSQKSIVDAETLYRQKLKLEAPAKYWSDRAQKLKAEGYWWLAGLIVCILTGIILLVWILSALSNGTLLHVFDKTGTAIKWSIAFITIISFLAYAIKVISKLTFSSFHLVRDAEEREQLTYVYLALHDRKVIDQTERHLIMQSLFSRADSGLLKDEASPTMPGMEKLFNR